MLHVASTTAIKHLGYFPLHKFLKVTFSPRGSTEYFPKSWEWSRCFNVEMWDYLFNLFWSAVGLILAPSHGCHVCPFSFFLQLIDKHWPEVRRVRVCCSSIASFVTSCMSPWWGNHGTTVTSGNVHQCFLRLWIMALIAVYWSLKASEMTL